jgi:hypothetical protein
MNALVEQIAGRTLNSGEREIERHWLWVLKDS